jgi:hypothetical protein
MERKPAGFSSDDRLEAKFKLWLSAPGINFKNAQKEKDYKDRITRIKDAIQLKKTPDRIPVVPHVLFFTATYSGITPQDAMYHYQKLYHANKKYVLDFQPDAHTGAFEASSGKVFDILDYKLYAWPGHGLVPTHTYQALEKEYMKAEEYDALISDPSDFFRAIYLPRVFGALEPWKKLPPLTSILELPLTGSNILAYGDSEIQNAYKALLKAGKEAQKWGKMVAAFDAGMGEYGFPNFFGGAAKAPFDVLGDTLRGTKGIIMDMYRRPEKLLEAIDVITPLMIKMGTPPSGLPISPIIFMPLHKGADGFLSDEQFKKFYWPSLKKVMLAFIDQGCIPFAYAEGGYNSRLEIIRELPKGKVIWTFDATDMLKAKTILGDVACIAGNIPSGILNLGTVKEVQEYTQKLIDTAGKNGGYIMTNGAVIEEAKPENVKAWMDYTKKFGVYR